LDRKFKKSGGPVTLQLEPTEDIVASVAQQKKAPFVVGFAAETHDVIANAQAKLARKGMDVIVANEVGPNKGFGAGEAAVAVITADSVEHMRAPSKEQLAPKLLSYLAAQWPAPQPTR
jgi:phosphopantothenoylcysteine decarboxylase/phosphopantothenate--cysteine ligase